MTSNTFNVYPGQLRSWTDGGTDIFIVINVRGSNLPEPENMVADILDNGILYPDINVISIVAWSEEVA
jgi:hypothetical protein